MMVMMMMMRPPDPLVKDMIVNFHMINRVRSRWRNRLIRPLSV